MDPTRSLVLDFLTDLGIEDATVLEIGGGVGELHLELLRRGARTATNLELSTTYETAATRLLEASGLGDRVTRRVVDIATTSREIEPADIVVLHRVVCCYPDYEPLLAAAARHARQLLVFSHPQRTLRTRIGFGFGNLTRPVRPQGVRRFAHPPQAMVDVVEAQGMPLKYRHGGPAWTVVAFERPRRAGATAQDLCADSALMSRTDAPTRRVGSTQPVGPPPNPISLPSGSR